MNHNSESGSCFRPGLYVVTGSSDSQVSRALKLSLWIIVTVVAMAAGTTLFVVDRGDPATGSTGLETAAANSSVVARTAVTALGRLEPETRVINVGGPESARVLSLSVTEHDFINAGEEIGRLDDYPQKLADVDRRRAIVEELERQLQAEEKLGQAKVKEADEKVDRLTQLKPLDLRIKEAIVRRLTAELQRQQEELDRLKNLEKINAATAGAMTDARSSTEQAREALEEANLTLERLQASLHLDELIAKTEAESARAQTERDIQIVGLESARAELKLAEAQVDLSVVRAPVSGTVLKVVTRPGERVTSDPIVQIGDTRQMYALAEVYETDVRFVRVGQKAQLTSPALEQPLTGVVEEVGLIVDRNSVLDIDPAAPIDSRVVEVRIRLDDSDVAARFVNLQVTVRIETGGASE